MSAVWLKRTFHFNTAQDWIESDGLIHIERELFKWLLLPSRHNTVTTFLFLLMLELNLFNKPGNTNETIWNCEEALLTSGTLHFFLKDFSHICGAGKKTLLYHWPSFFMPAVFRTLLIVCANIERHKLCLYIHVITNKVWNWCENVLGLYIVAYVVRRDGPPVCSADNNRWSLTAQPQNTLKKSSAWYSLWENWAIASFLISFLSDSLLLSVSAASTMGTEKGFWAPSCMPNITRALQHCNIQHCCKFHVWKGLSGLKFSSIWILLFLSSFKVMLSFHCLFVNIQYATPLRVQAGTKKIVLCTLQLCYLIMLKQKIPSVIFVTRWWLLLYETGSAW